MLEAGVGTVRFEPIEIRGQDYWLCAATSDDYCHTGIPIAIPNHIMQRNIGFNFNFYFTVTGQVRFLPEILKIFFVRFARIPQIYILVEEIQQNEPISEPLIITPLVFFTGGEFTGRTTGHEGNVTYVACDSNRVENLDRAVNWLNEYVDRYYGKIMTDFDQRSPSPIFYDAPFSLQKIMNGNVKEIALQQFFDIDEATVICDNINIQSKETVMTKVEVTLGDGNVIRGNIIVAGKIEKSFNRAAESNVPNEIKDLLKKLSSAVGKMSEQLSQEEGEAVAEDLEILVKQATREKPQQRWWQVSVEGLTKAAENIGQVGKPVIEILKQLVPLLRQQSV